MDKKQALLDLARSASAHSYADLAKAAGCKPQTVWRSAKQWGISAQLAEIFKSTSPATETTGQVAKTAPVRVKDVVDGRVTVSAALGPVPKARRALMHEKTEWQGWVLTAHAKVEEFIKKFGYERLRAESEALPRYTRDEPAKGGGTMPFPAYHLWDLITALNCIDDADYKRQWDERKCFKL